MNGHDFYILDATFIHAGYIPRVALKCSTCGLSCTGLIESDGDKIAAEYVDSQFSTGEPNPFDGLRLVGAAAGDCVGRQFFQ